ncbi:MAG: Fic family protein [Chloroflexi bacterium]|nr:Fic family protein [Chloroflexota bacterium]
MLYNWGMSNPPPPWRPNYTLTSSLARGLMDIEAARAVVEQNPLPAAAEAELRQRARIRATHYSTRIEGNRLTLEEAAQVIAEKDAKIRGRERDVREVRNYWNALLRVEEWAAQQKPITGELVRRLHALVEYGTRAAPTPYRDRQNGIRDSASGNIVYLPPEAKDVPALMAALVNWVNWAEQGKTPVPVVAGLAHYQFVTIHPYYDGNGRTARLLATFLLHRGGYGLHGFFSLEEHHARDLAAHPHHNYYEGRADADLTPWLAYFTSLLAGVFGAARDEALRLKASPPAPEPEHLRRLDRRARLVLGLFARREEITASQVAEALGLSDRMARNLLQEWTADGWLVAADPSRRKRAYKLSAIYWQSIGSLSAMK